MVEREVLLQKIANRPALTELHAKREGRRRNWTRPSSPHLEQNRAIRCRYQPGAASNLPSSKPTRRLLPAHLPRETHQHKPAETVCPDCGGALRQLGEDFSEMLEYVPARFKVIRHVRSKLSCSACERIVQSPAPTRAIERGYAGPGLLAHVLGVVEEAPEVQHTISRLP
jgi:transposase IS66-like protein